jgi:hypothetical protein
MDQSIQLKTLHGDDIDDVLAVQKKAYLPALLETGETFRRKMKLCPDGAWGVSSELQGYIFAHPWKLESVVTNGCFSWAEVLPCSRDWLSS